MLPPELLVRRHPAADRPGGVRTVPDPAGTTRRRWRITLRRPAAGGPTPSTPLLLATLLAVLAVSVVVAASVGPVPVPPSSILAMALRPLAAPLAAVGVDLAEVDPAHASLVTTVRLPRVLLACLVGAALSMAGAVMQAVFRNPLAEPGITGVSSGAAVAAVLLLVTGLADAGAWVIPAGAFAGAMLTVMTVQLVAGVRRAGSPATLLLVGIALNALLGAVIAAALANAPNPDDTRRAMFWLNGDLTASTWPDVLVALGPVLLGGAALLCFTRELDLMLLPDDVAASTGMRTQAVRQAVLALAAFIAAASVAVTGIISFVGLVVPHLVRLVIGPGHRRLLPVSAVVGAVVLCVADLGARMLFSPVVLQTGTVTALLGAPVLLALVLRDRPQGRRG